MNKPDPLDHVPDSSASEPRCGLKLTRRSVLLGGSLAAAGLAAYPVYREIVAPRAAAFLAKASGYDASLTRILHDGLIAAGLQVESLHGKSVLLKPNLVEPLRSAPHMTTNPAMVVAAAEVFRSWGARVTVGEGPGHVRDTEMALVEGGMLEPLSHEKLEFIDLNYDDVVWRENRGRQSGLDGFFLPRAVAEADLIVSMPKLKTHHWMGVTASMKNLYGILPGVQYGWPKNVLHYAGIPETVFDINAAVPNTIAIVDAIECMEGDGPIMGTPRKLGLVIIGTNLPAVDATACRLMEVDARQVPYLGLAADRLGPISERRIEQRGENWRPLAQRFEIIDAPHLRGLRPA
jgi:uncharacterized protein (DUF362 family)